MNEHSDRDQSEQPVDLLAALQGSLDRAREHRRTSEHKMHDHSITVDCRPECPRWEFVKERTAATEPDDAPPSIDYARRSFGLPEVTRVDLSGWEEAYETGLAHDRSEQSCACPPLGYSSTCPAHGGDLTRSTTPHAPVAAGADPVQSRPAVIDAAHLERQRVWSRETFGPHQRVAGILDHIRKELREVEADPTDVTEWADVVILALDGAWRAGHEPQAVLDAIVAKQARNEARTWPDWRTADPDKAIEHVRPSGSTPEPSQAVTEAHSGEERAARYAEAMQVVAGGSVGHWTSWRREAYAVMAVADAEQAELRAEVDDLSSRLSALLCDLTRGRLSKTNYDVRTMVQAVEEAFEEDAAEAEARAEAAEAKVARVEALPAEWLGSVGVLNAIFETLSEHATVTQSDGPHGPYVWCGCGWRSDEQPGCDPGPASVIHVSNAVHAAVTPAIREGLTVRVRAALAGPEPATTEGGE